MGTHGSWLPEAADTRVKVFADGDPGYTQMRAISQEEDLGAYDHFYTVGRNVGTDRSTVPTMGKAWRPMFDPVVVDLFPLRPVLAQAPFTTIMAWQSYGAIEYEGHVYGAKDREFMRFIDLPRLAPEGYGSMLMSSRTLLGLGDIFGVPMIQVETLGAGGGSIGWTTMSRTDCGIDPGSFHAQASA